MIQKNYSGDRIYTVSFIAGVVGAAALSAILALARGFNLTFLNVEMILGSMLTATAGTGTWLVGLVWHLINGGVFALLYAAGFQSIGRMNVSTGVAFGMAHWVVAGVLLGVLPVLHPLMPELLNAPGFFAVNGGFIDLSAFFVLHLVYGGIVGSICQRKMSFVLLKNGDINLEIRHRRTRRAA